MTGKELCRIERTSSLVEQLELLGKKASKILGYKVIADLCNGGELEFRIVGKDDIADSNSCIRMEEVINKLSNIK